MGQILSQKEVDALLSAVHNDELDSHSEYSDPSHKDVNIQPYDLTNQDRVIRGRMPILDIIYERFIRTFRVSISNSLRKISTISIISTDLLKFGEFVNTLPIPSCMCIMRLNELRGLGMLVFESKLVYAIIDSYFGGTDQLFTKIEGKEFTMIELSFMKKVMEMAINDLEEAWSPVHRIDAQYLRTEINPQFVGVVPPSEIVITTVFEVEFESASGSIMIVIPYATIEPIKQKLNSNFQTEGETTDSIWTKAMQGHIMDTPMELVAKLGEADMTIGDLITLKEGDIIPLQNQASGEAVMAVENVDKIKCLMGVHKGHKAVQITDTIGNQLKR